MSLINHDFQWGRSEVVIIYPDPSASPFFPIKIPWFPGESQPFPAVAPEGVIDLLFVLLPNQALDPWCARARASDVYVIDSPGNDTLW